jgi:hypothetical protein
MKCFIAFLLASLPATAWGGNSDEESWLTFDDEGMGVKFTGDSLNFRGREIRNAALVDSTIEGLSHLTVNTIAIRSQVSRNKRGHGLAIVDSDGIISSTGHLRWNEESKSLKVSMLEPLGDEIDIDSDVNLKSHKLSNAKLSPGTVLDGLEFRNGKIEDTVLHNVKATGLTLGDVAMDSLAINEFSSKPLIGSMLVVGENGAVEASSTLKQENDGDLRVNSKVVFSKPIDLSGQEIQNAKMASGSIEGQINISAQHISAKDITIREIRDDKTITSDRLAMLGLNGRLTMSPIKVNADGSLGNIQISGTMDFAEDSGSSIANAEILGGSISGVKSLQVKGKADLGGGLHVSGEAFVDGALTVSGSVLGSGPYVDLSDQRFKKNINRIPSAEALDKILQLEGVSYDLDFTEMLSLDRFNGTVIDAGDRARQLGFIAQDVEQVLPELVYNDEEGWKGLHYSRLAPLLVESVKQVTTELENLKLVVAQLMQELNRTRA